MTKQLKVVVSTTGQLFSNILHHSIRLILKILCYFLENVQQNGPIQSKSHSRTYKKFFRVLSIVQLPIVFFGSRLVPLINYAIGPSTLNYILCHYWHCAMQMQLYGFLSPPLPLPSALTPALLYHFRPSSDTKGCCSVTYLLFVHSREFHTFNSCFKPL